MESDSRGRLLIVVGMVMFLMAATLVVVAENMSRRTEASVVIVSAPR